MSIQFTVKYDERLPFAFRLTDKEGRLIGSNIRACVQVPTGGLASGGTAAWLKENH